MSKEWFEDESPLWGYLRPAFSQKQRRYILDRDGETCQAPIKHRCNGKEKPLHCHHIIPQGYAKRYGIDPDIPENGITLCESFHLNIIHPDTIQAKHEYSQDKGSFGKLKERRARLLDQKKPYWNTVHDRSLTCIALRNQQRYEKDFEFPKKRGEE